MDRFQNKYRVPSARTVRWDYGNNAVCFITICTQKRYHYSGEIEKNQTDTELIQPFCQNPDNEIGFKTSK